MKMKLVGILNITPDSFSDGGKFNTLDAALKQTQKMIDDGADVIDIGAESTRPTATKITVDEEWQRLEKFLPQIIALIKKSSRPIKSSIDSYHFENLKKSYELGVDIINDVTGLSDERTVDFIAAKNIETILMHNVAVPAPQGSVVNRNINLVGEMLLWANQKIANLEKKGVKKSQLVFDPGIGFAKDALQSIRILKNIDSFRSLDLPIYIGHSKKSFLAAIDFSDYKKDLSREEKTLIISRYLVKKNVDFIRVHDVLEHSILLKEGHN